MRGGSPRRRGRAPAGAGRALIGNSIGSRVRSPVNRDPPAYRRRLSISPSWAKDLGHAHDMIRLGFAQGVAPVSTGLVFVGKQRGIEQAVGVVEGRPEQAGRQANPCRSRKRGAAIGHRRRCRAVPNSRSAAAWCGRRAAGRWPRSMSPRGLTGRQGRRACWS